MISEITPQQHQSYPVFRQVAIVTLILFITIFYSVLQTGPDASYSVGTLVTPPNTTVSNTQTHTVSNDLDESVLQTVFGGAQIEAKNAIIYDVIHSQVLFDKDAESPVPIASLTKLMTAILVTELVDELTVVEITEAAIAQHGNSGLRVGERITIQDLNNYSLLSSSNNAAYALAVSIGEMLIPNEGAAGFVDAMNVKAEELELSDTVFLNPTGLDISATTAGAEGSAKDMALLTTYILKNHPELLRITTIEDTQIFNELGEFHQAQNTNRLVGDIPQLIGGKTGFTTLAGGNLMTVFDAGFNRPIIIVVLGSSIQGRFNDTRTLLNSTKSLWQQ